jgi:hypothetical protein
MHNFSLKVWRSSGLSWWKTGLILRLIFLANIILLTSCDSFYGDYQGNERNKMEVVKESSVSHVSQPPVDLNVPAKVETATFALG